MGNKNIYFGGDGLGESREKIIAGRDSTEIPTLNTTEFTDLHINLRENFIHWKTKTRIKLEENVQKCDTGVTASNAAGEKTTELNITVLG